MGCDYDFDFDNYCDHDYNVYVQHFEFDVQHVFEHFEHFKLDQLNQHVYDHSGVNWSGLEQDCSFLLLTSFN